MGICPALRLDNGMCPVKLIFRLDVVVHVDLILKESEIGLMIVYACRKCCHTLTLFLSRFSQNAGVAMRMW